MNDILLTTELQFVLSVPGSTEAHSTKRRLTKEVINARSRHIVCNLSGIDMLYSIDFSLIIHLKKVSERCCKTLSLVNTCSAVYKLLKDFNFHKILNIFEKKEDYTLPEDDGNDKYSTSFILISNKENHINRILFSGHLIKDQDLSQLEKFTPDSLTRKYYIDLHQLESIDVYGVDKLNTLLSKIAQVGAKYVIKCDNEIIYYILNISLLDSKKLYSSDSMANQVLNEAR